MDGWVGRYVDGWVDGWMGRMIHYLPSCSAEG